MISHEVNDFVLLYPAESFLDRLAKISFPGTRISGHSHDHGLFQGSEMKQSFGELVESRSARLELKQGNAGEVVEV